MVPQAPSSVFAMCLCSQPGWLLLVESQPCLSLCDSNLVAGPLPNVQLQMSNTDEEHNVLDSK